MRDLGIISPAMMKLFSESKEKFIQRYIMHLPTPVLDIGFMTGKNIHALASYFLKGNNITKFLDILNPKETGCWEYLQSCKYFKYEVMGVETNLTMRLKEFWIGGRIDALVRYNRDYYILDYKTGSITGDMTYDYQTMVYLLLCDRAHQNYSSLNFVYLDLNNKRELIIKFTDDLKSEYEERLSDICKKMSEIKISEINYMKL